MRKGSWLIFCFVCAPAYGEWSGYFKTYSVGTFPKSEKVMALLQPSARLNYKRVEGEYSFDAAYQLAPQFQTRRAARVVGDGNENYRVQDFTSPMARSGDHRYALFHNLDRLNVRWEGPRGDITFGRQAVTFGVARVISPLDVLVPFGQQALDQEYRQGVDGLRWQMPIGELSEFDMGVVLGKDGRQDESAIFLRTRLGFPGNDLEFLIMQYREAGLLGLSWQRSLFGAGLWLEGARTWPVGEKHYDRLTVGMDYSPASGWTALAEYHYSGAGSFEVSEFQSPKFAQSRGGVFYLGRQYFSPGVSWQMSALTAATVQGIYNLVDRSALVSVGVQHNLTQNSFVDAGVFAAAGRPGGSEYGLYPSLAYLAYRTYF